MNKQYYTIKQLIEHPTYKGLYNEQSIRDLRRNNVDGFNACTIKRGGSVYIDIEKFGKWFKGEYKEAL